MAFSLSSAKLTGNPGVSGWAQVHEFVPTDPEKLASRGHLFAVVATGRHEEGLDAVSAGRELLSRLHEEYFGPEGSAFAILAAAVKKVTAEFRQSWGEVEISAVSLVGDVVYSVAAGGAQVAIFRNGILANILESSKGEVISASGYPQEGDMLVVGTKLFFATFPGGVIKAALASGDPLAAVESFAPTVHSRQDSGSLGVTVISFAKKSELFTKPEVPPKEAEKPQPLASFRKKALEKIREFLAQRLPERKIYVREGQMEEAPSQRRKVMVTVGGILLALLVVSIGFGVRAKNIKEQKSRYEARLTQAQHEFEESLSLFSLNPERARELFISAKGTADSLKSEGVKDKALDELVKNLDANQGKVLGEYREEAELFVDLSILSSGLKGDDMAASSEMLFVLDKAGKRVVSANFSTKKTEVVAGPEQIEAAEGAAVYEDRVFILNSDGIFEVGEEKSRATNRDWEGEALVYAYAGNLYVVDKAAGVIWRYPGSGKTFGSKSNWFAPGITVDLNNIKGLTIDGTIWLLSVSGKISKFSLGNPQNFAPAGVFPELANPDAIYTNEEQDFLYVLEKERKRIVVLEKDGKYKAQYLSDKLGEATDLAVNEKEGKMVVLAGDKLYSLEIKHL
ncbi:MAG: hypothetical protein ACOYT7_01505 [Patescibacteria group bacterium]